MNKRFNQQSWDLEIEQAMHRPAMYIGGQKTAHLSAISSCLSLVRKAEAFNKFLSATVYLSPNQYVILCEAGPLLTEIGKLYTWEDKYILMENWSLIDQNLRDEFQSTEIESPTYENWPEWKRLFASPSGPTLNSATYPVILSKRFIVAFYLSDGYWCQGFRHSRPETAPFHVQASSPISLLAAADLNPTWFTGLPYTIDDIEKINSLSNVKAVWHPQNDLLMDNISSQEQLAKWLQP